MSDSKKRTITRMLGIASMMGATGLFTEDRIPKKGEEKPFEDSYLPYAIELKPHHGGERYLGKPKTKQPYGTKWLGDTENLTVRPFQTGKLNREILVYGETEAKALKNLKLKLKHEK